MSISQKTVQDYRKIIFYLKGRIAQQQQAVDQLKQQYSPYNLTEDQSDLVKMKKKILELSIAQFNKKERVVSSHPASSIYTLIFAMKKLNKACEVFNIAPEMIYRCANRKMEPEVAKSQFQRLLSQTYQIPLSSVVCITDHLTKTDKIQFKSYDYLLECFFMKKQEKIDKTNIFHEAQSKMIQLLKQKKIKLQGLWTQEQLDAGQFAYGLIAQLKQLTDLEAISIFEMMDVERSGIVNKKQIVMSIREKMDEYKPKNRGL